MKEIAFFDTKPYDKNYFDKMQDEYGFHIKYFENKLNADTAILASGCQGIVAFVNDDIDQRTINHLYENGVRVIALRCAGYNNVDLKSAYEKIHVLRVPAYSPFAVAEHAMALLLTLNRKTHKAYNRTREHNFSINGLAGFDLHDKTIGIVGTGKIGRVFIDICRGFGMRVIAHDPFPATDIEVEYVSFKQLCLQSDIISLHCPLTRDTHHLINKDTLALMKNGIMLINTSRGALIDSEALLDSLKTHKVGGVCLDVYEEEADLFFEDFSNDILQDDVLARLFTMPNVLITGHQAFFTNEALNNIAQTTLENLKEYFDGKQLKNEICYQCFKLGVCDKRTKTRCF